MWLRFRIINHTSPDHDMRHVMEKRWKVLVMWVGPTLDIYSSTHMCLLHINLSPIISQIIFSPRISPTIATEINPIFSWINFQNVEYTYSSLPVFEILESVLNLIWESSPLIEASVMFGEQVWLGYRSWWNLSLDLSRGDAFLTRKKSQAPRAKF